MADAEVRGSSSAEISEELRDQMIPGVVTGKQLPRLVAYMIGCFCVLVMGGGLILGSGPFAAALIREGYIPKSAASTLFVGAFQMLTWGTVLAAHLLGRLGPRITALIGACISIPGIVIMAFLPNPAAPGLVTIAYGLIGAGGNHIYLSTFHFAQLFPDRMGLADGVVAGLFNAAGLVLLILSVPGMTIHGIFTAWIFVAVGVMILIFLFYPDKEYTGDDLAVMSTISLQHAKSPLPCTEYVVNFKYLCNIRFILFVFSFGSASVIVSWVNGVLIGDLYFDLPPAFLNIAQPLACNSCVLFTWIVGGLIDKYGFAITSFCQGCFCMTLAFLTFWRHSVPAAWLCLLFLNWCNSVLYTQQFVFLHKVFGGDKFPTALIAALVVQGSMLFIASPGLTGAFDSDHYVDPSAILLGWCCLLFIWPLCEMLIFRPADLEAAEDNDDLMKSRSVLGSIIGKDLANGPA